MLNLTQILLGTCVGSILMAFAILSVDLLLTDLRFNTKLYGILASLICGGIGILSAILLIVNVIITSN